MNDTKRALCHFFLFPICSAVSPTIVDHNIAEASEAACNSHAEFLPQPQEMSVKLKPFSTLQVRRSCAMRYHEYCKV
ncbi:hypothetical protein BDV97DRAFT_348356 [Delphinella strobiligena]|nr:hypothetical protein BDV97DRAFT_348356 [Delphinella strobiligena]